MHCPVKATHRSLSVLLLSLILSASSAVQTFAQQDKVRLVSGTTLTGEITSATPNEISITVRGKAQNVPTIDISTVEFDGEPNDLTRAKEALAQNQLDQAEQQIKAVAAASLKSEAVKNDYAYYRGAIAGRLALAGQGDSTAAVKALLAFAKSNPKSHHFYELCEIVGGLAVGLGQHAEAVKYFSAIGNAPFPAYKLKSSYLVGSATLAQGKAAEAKAEFDKIVAASAIDAESQRYQKLATVASIRAEIVAGSPQEAVDKLLKLVSTSDSADILLFGEIYNTLGEAHLALSQLAEAKLAYLHTDLMFSGDADNHAEALYQLGILWEKTGNPQKSIEARSRLKERYAASIWARK